MRIYTNDSYKPGKLKNKQQDIKQFELSAKAKAGVFIVNMQNQEREEHDISKPHRDNHYLLMLASHGRFKLNLDFEEVVFTAPMLLCVFPEQVHYIITVNEPQGWIISFDPSLVERELRQMLENKCINQIIVEKQSPFYQQAFALFDLIEKRQSGLIDTYTYKSIHFLLNALLSVILDKVVALSYSEKGTENRGNIIKDTFNQLLKKHYKTWKQPAQYASELAVSVSHLNDTVKALTGFPVSVHIQQASILEAKRLLYFTDNSVKEVSYEVGYDEPVYFGKLFKKVTNLTPLQFRQKFRV